MYLEYWDKVDVTVFYVFAGVSALVTILSIGLVLLGCCTKKKFIPGAAVDFLIVIGILLVVCCVLMHGLDVAWATRDIFEDMCEVYIAPLLFGLCYIFGGYLIKACAIYHYHRKEGGKHARSVEWKPMGWLFLLVIVDAACVLVWCIMFTMKLEAGSYECVGEHDWEWKIAMAAYHGFLLFLAAIMVWPAMDKSKKFFSSTESTCLAVMTYNAVFSVIAGCLVYFLVDTTDTILFAVTGGLLLWICLFTVIMLLASHLSAARKRRNRRDDEMSLNPISDAASSKAGYENDGYSTPITNNIDVDEKGDTFSY